MNNEFVEISAHTYLMDCKNKIDYLEKKQANLFYEIKQINLTFIDSILFFSSKNILFRKLKDELGLNNKYITELANIIFMIYEKPQDKMKVNINYLSYVHKIN